MKAHVLLWNPDGSMIAEGLHDCGPTELIIVNARILLNNGRCTLSVEVRPSEPDEAPKPPHLKSVP